MRKAGDVCFSEVYREGGGELVWVPAAVLFSLFPLCSPAIVGSCIIR